MENKNAIELIEIKGHIIDSLILPQIFDEIVEAGGEFEVGINEIFVYLGSLVIFLSLAFLVSLNWKALGSVGRILSILIPT
ncbi:unnamed protein product, partial [marine sediment metagenome]